MAEKFWSIHMSYQAPAGPAGGGRCQFEWRRGRLFDHVAATVLYELCCEDAVAHVLRVRFPGPMQGSFGRPVLVLLNRQSPNSAMSPTAGPKAKLLPHTISLSS